MSFRLLGLGREEEVDGLGSAAKGAPAPAELREPAEAAAVHEMRRRRLHDRCILATDPADSAATATAASLAGRVKRNYAGDRGGGSKKVNWVEEKCEAVVGKKNWLSIGGGSCSRWVRILCLRRQQCRCLSLFHQK